MTLSLTLRCECGHHATYTGDRYAAMVASVEAEWHRWDRRTGQAVCEECWRREHGSTEEVMTSDASPPDH